MPPEFRELRGNTTGEAELIARTGEQGIRLFPFTSTCASGTSDITRLLIGFGGLTGDEIEAGLAFLARLCA